VYNSGEQAYTKYQSKYTTQPKHINQTQPQHKHEHPKHNKPLIIDNKTFSISQVGGRNYPFCILERKFGKLLGKIWIGSKDIEWLGTTIDSAINHGTARNFFKHRRDGYKAIHVVNDQTGMAIFLKSLSFTVVRAKGYFVSLRARCDMGGVISLCCVGVSGTELLR
jgi:hypothetical protein